MTQHMDRSLFVPLSKDVEWEGSHAKTEEKIIEMLIEQLLIGNGGEKRVEGRPRLGAGCHPRNIA